MGNVLNPDPHKGTIGGYSGYVSDDGASISLYGMPANALPARAFRRRSATG